MAGVFSNIREYAEGKVSLEYSADGELSPDDVRIAVTAILAQVACEDGEFTAQELTSLVSCLGSEFDIPENKVGYLLDVARLLSSEPSKLKELSDKVTQHFDIDQRGVILAILWRVILADGKTSPKEASIAALIRNQLGLSLEQGLRARKMAELGEIGPLAQALAISDNDSAE